MPTHKSHLVPTCLCAPRPAAEAWAPATHRRAGPSGSLSFALSRGPRGLWTRPVGAARSSLHPGFLLSGARGPGRDSCWPPTPCLGFLGAEDRHLPCPPTPGTEDDEIDRQGAALGRRKVR